MEKVNLAEKFSKIERPWTPFLVGELNGQYVKLARCEGEMIWHSHENEDELFFVVRGLLRIHLRDRRVDIQEGEFFIVPKGVEHKPEALMPTELMLFEPKETAHTGRVESHLTHNDQSWL